MSEDSKSIRNISLPNKKRTAKKKKSTTKKTHHNMLPRLSWRVWAVAFAGLIVFVLAVSVLFEKATVIITPRTERISIEKNLVAVPESNTEKEITYEIVELSETKSGVVEATTTISDPQKARGTITVYNEYTSEPLRLVKETRFEASTGRIYKTPTQISVPGMKREDGEITPGELDVSVVAAEPGSEYNTAETTFTVPGLESDGEAFEKVYARNKSSLSGGAVEGEFVISDAQKESLISAKKDSLETQLRERIEAETPSDFIFLDSLYTITYAVETKAAQNEGEASVNVTGTIKALVVDENHLIEHIRPQQGDDVPEVKKQIESLKNLTVSYEGESPLVISSEKDIPFSLSGFITLVWDVDYDALSDDLRGRSKRSFESILQSYDAISEAELTIRPVWKRSFPDAKKDIVIINSLENDPQ